jgi:hypothetical protein
MPEEERRDFFLYVDEFQSFATESFASILSEARKYRLCLTLSHQYTDQLRPEIREAVFGNVGSLISFRVGHRDAQMLEGEFGDGFNARRFAELSNYEVCAKVLVGGQDREPFFGKTFPSHGKHYGRREIIIQRSRQKYAAARETIEDRICRWAHKGHQCRCRRVQNHSAKHLNSACRVPKPI